MSLSHVTRLTYIFDSACAAILGVFTILWQQGELEAQQLKDPHIYCTGIMQPCVVACGQRAK